MGLVIDTNIWILAEKSAKPLDLSKWFACGGAFMSSITASELLVGIERASSEQRKTRRAAFVESLLAQIPVLDFSLPVARTHARVIASIPKNLTPGAHDALIAATAIHYGYHLLTQNIADFKIFPGLKLEAFETA